MITTYMGNYMFKHIHNTSNEKMRLFNSLVNKKVVEIARVRTDLTNDTIKREFDEYYSKHNIDSLVTLDSCINLVRKGEPLPWERT